MSSGPVWLRLSFGNLPFFGRITHVKKSWGRAYQQSSKGTSWRSSSMQYGNGGTTTMVSNIYQYIPGISQYILVYTRINLVYTSIYHNEYGISEYILSIYWYIPVCTQTGIYQSVYRLLQWPQYGSCYAFSSAQAQEGAKGVCESVESHCVPALPDPP